MLGDRPNAWLIKSIKLHKKVISVFQYPYFWDDPEDFEAFRKDVLFRLIDQQKLMEAELSARRGRL